MAEAAGTGGLRPFPREELADAACEVAPRLLGALLRHGPVLLQVTEVEAYAGRLDPGSHAARGPTARNGTMFRGAGRAYVYLSYGLHHCLNVVCGPEGEAGAVLLRAAEVVAGEEEVRARRDAAVRAPHARRDLARGPGRLGSALGVQLAHDGSDLCDPAAALQLASGAAVGPETVRSGPRVGVSGPGGDGELFPWRWWVEGAAVSAYRPGRVGPGGRS